VILSKGIEPEEAEAAHCRARFRRYVERAWREIDPKPFIPNWHVDAICDHLQALYERKIKRLIINVPPGTAKSMLCSVLWPSWVWTKDPSWQLLGASYEVGLATRDAVKARDLMRGEWYTRWFRGPESPFTGEPWDFQADQDLKTHYKNTQLGTRQALGVGGKGTGYRGHALLIDDPISAKDAHSEIIRKACVTWKDETMSSRFNDKENATELLIMQRLHEEDLTGHLLRKGGWEHLRLPAEHETKTPKVHFTGPCQTFKADGTPFWKDPRTQPGELLFPKLFPQHVLETLKKDLGSYGYAGQYQQRPAPAEGGILKREWFGRRWYIPGHESPVEGFTCRPIPDRFPLYAVFVDASFKDTKDSDKVAIGVFGIDGPDIYLLRLIWDRLSFTATVQALLDLRNKWPRLSGIYIEDKANGTAIMDTLKSKIAGLVPIEPDGGKESRIHAASPFIEAGNLWLPLNAAWVDDYITEAISFPKAPHDDAIDMTGYALLKFCGRNNSSLLEALARE
jgi:predicted phage terminase large subunit-like protein